MDESLSFLEKVPHFTKPNIKWEQYITPKQIAHKMFNIPSVNFQDQKVIELGCGTGRLTIGSLLLGAKNVLGIDIDLSAILLLKKFAEDNNFLERISLINSAVEFLPFQKKRKREFFADILIMNPPFGTKRSGIDVVFLRKAFTLAPTIISLHKSNIHSRNIINKEANSFDFDTKIIEKLDYDLPPSYSWHIKNKHKVEVDLYLFQIRNFDNNIQSNHYD